MFRIPSLATLAAFIMFGAVGATHAQAIEGSRAFNDNSLIAIQEKGGDPGRPGDVKIEYYGHSAFKVTSPEGITVLVDPWRNDPTGFWGKWFFTEFPQIPVDIVVSTHAHFDHDAVNRPHALMVFERPIGKFQLGDVEITGLADKHQCVSPDHHKWDQISAVMHISTCPPNNVLGFDNTIQIVHTGGLRIAFWGDNRARPNPFLDDQLRNVDVLVLPIDGSKTILTYDEVHEIIARYKPRAVIPAHYLVRGLTTDVSGLQSADEWVKTQSDVHRIEDGELVLNPAELNGAKRRVYYFGDGYETK
ncbi:MAG TPA: MBL fold metallo-hydrolase [Acidobacteriaceae bacterium]|nr:MBL fold metallo-hydrolase [Acidobacteriaceae bacterium]